MNFLIFLLMAVFSSTLEVSSSAFKANELIPMRYSCEGENISPALTVKNLPAAAKSMAIIMDDPDAPGTFVHWVMWNIEPGATIGEKAAGGVNGTNGKGTNGYTGPCPPSGTHHYHFKIYALDTKLDLKETSGKSGLEAAMKNHVLATGEIIGLYAKQNK